MANVLSQDEIDELLSALNSSDGADLLTAVDEPVATVRQYDFRTANKFTKDQMRTIQFAFTNFCHLLSNHLSVKLRVACDASIVSQEEQLFSEFYNALPEPVILAIMTMSPFEGNILMQISPEVAYSMVNSLLGGAGRSASIGRTFTEIELVIIERFIRQFLPLITESWSKVMRVEPYISRVETTPQFAQIVAMNEAMAIITLEIHIGETSGLLSFSIPHMAVTPIAKQLNSRLLYSSAVSAVADNSDTIRQLLTRSQVNIRAVFKETTATVHDILSLQEGDVIQLDQSVTEPILIKLEHMVKFHAFIGTHGSHYAVQIADIIKEGESYE